MLIFNPDAYPSVRRNRKRIEFVDNLTLERLPLRRVLLGVLFSGNFLFRFDLTQLVVDATEGH